MGRAEIPSEWMRCAACGAPLRLREGLGAWVCDVCGSAVVVFGGGGGTSYAGGAGGNTPPDGAVGPEAAYITRQAAVEAALSWYHKYMDLGNSMGLQQNVQARLNAYACASAAKNIVCALMELPEAGGEDDA